MIPIYPNPVSTTDKGYFVKIISKNRVQCAFITSKVHQKLSNSYKFY